MFCEVPARARHQQGQITNADADYRQGIAKIDPH
jgi:hypothetical protein